MSYAVQTYAGHVAMRVVARLDEQIGYLGDLLHLDGPLFYATYHDLDLATRKTLEPIETTAWPTDFKLPLSTWWVDYDPAQHGAIDPQLLKRNRRGRSKEPQLWGWCASAVDDETWLVRSKLEIRKKPALKDMVRYTDAGTHNVASGHMKAYDLTVPTVLSREAVWYAHGDPDRVRYLLSKYIPAIGKKRNIGAGTVREWIVEPIEDTDPPRWLHRRMPVGAVEGALRQAAIRPPYHHHSRMALAVEPC